jgi:3-oxoacyl-[acyl-carrier protein] reductase
MEQRLNGKIAIVTGASRGIGKAIATLYAAHGADVLVVYRKDEAGAQQTLADIRAAGGEASLFQGDVSRVADTEAMAATAIQRYGRIDILCANAAVFPMASILEMSEAQWDEIHDVNLKGTFLAVKACVPQMKTQRYGKIVVISSTSGGRVGLAGASNYCASKAGQVGFVLAACLELAPDNITINAILPGCVATEGFVKGMGEERLAILTREIPMKRLAEPLEIAHGALFFSTDESRYITGQTLVIDGGMIVPEVPAELARL